MTSRFLLVPLLVSAVASADRAAVPPESPAPTPPTPPTHAGSRELPAVIAPTPPRRQPLPPKPAPIPLEVATRGKLLAGSYTCKGHQATGSGASRPVEGTLVVALDLDNAWLRESWSSNVAKAASYTTYDGTAHQWIRLEVRNDGSHAMLTSLGDKGGEWIWEGPAVSWTGTIQERHHEQLSGTELKVRGEALLGGTWQKSYELSCKR
jgi:hypothetical protein